MRSSSQLLDAGLAALHKKLVERIIAYDYIDFNELLAAKGKNEACPPNSRGANNHGTSRRSTAIQETNSGLPDLAAVFCIVC